MILFFFFAGMTSLFFAERFFPDSTLHLPLVAVGIVLTCAALVLRQRATRTANPSLKDAYHLSISLMLVSVSAVGLYWLTTDFVLTPLKLDESLVNDIDVASSVFTPIIWHLRASSNQAKA